MTTTPIPDVARALAVLRAPLRSFGAAWAARCQRRLARADLLAAGIEEAEQDALLSAVKRLAEPARAKGTPDDERFDRWEEIRARAKLRSWGLSDHGTLLAAAPTLDAAVAADTSIATAYAERSIAEQGDPWMIDAGIPSGAGAVPLSGPCCPGDGS